MSEPTVNITVLVEQTVKALVSAPDQVFVTPVDEDGETVLELEVAEEDMGKIIGRQGRTVRALRTLVAAVGVRMHKRFGLEILE